jgi:hypothetical protein
MTELTLCLRLVREEVLMALGAENAEEERLHRALADSLTAEAVQDIASAPDAPHDWSLLAIPA